MLDNREDLEEGSLSGELDRNDGIPNTREDGLCERVKVRTDDVVMCARYSSNDDE